MNATHTPCPTWCTSSHQPDGPTELDAALARTHRHRLGEVRGVQSSRERFVVDVDREDGDAHAVVYLAGEGSLDAPAARRLAAELLNAADLLDSLPR